METYTNLDYQARLYRTGCMGCSNSLVIRGNPTPLASDKSWDDAYVFQYSTYGNYGIWKQVNGSWEWLQPWTYSPAINTGYAWNTLRVYADGSNLYFLINGSLVWIGSDTSLTSGRVVIMPYSNGSSDDKVYVDYAVLDILESASVTETISAEQQALNEAANQSEATGDPRFYIPDDAE